MEKKIKRSDFILHIIFAPFLIFYWIGTGCAYMTFRCNGFWSDIEKKFNN